MKSLLRDLRYAGRVLIKSPRFSLMVILTLAIGIGVNVSNFSIVNAFLLRPLDFEEPDRLVQLFRTDAERGIDRMRFSLPTVVEFRENLESFEEIAAYYYFNANFASPGAEPENITAGHLTGNMFAVLGVDAAQGRVFSPEDALDGRVVVLSHGLWNRRYGGEDVIGKTVTIDDEAYTILGVMAPEFVFPYGGVKAWIPVRPDDETFERSWQNFMPVARLAEGISFDQAEGELAALYRNIQQEHYPEDDKTGAVVTNLRQALLFLYDIVSLSLLLLMVGGFFMLLIICTNIANLFLVRAIHREREVAVRAALGAGRLSLVRQLLAEGLVLALIGGALGVALAQVMLTAVSPVIPQDLYRVGALTVDGQALAFSLLISLTTVLLMALPPALQTFKTDLTLSLKDAAASTQGSVKARRSQNFLVVAQISLAAAMLVGTVLAVRSFANLQGVEPGFETDQVLTLRLQLSEGSFETGQQVTDFHNQLADRLLAVPGIEAAAFTAPLPMNFETWGARFSLPGREDSSVKEMMAVGAYVSPGYFDSLGIRLLAGRDFTRQDTRDGQPVVLVNQTFADRYFSGDSPVGRSLNLVRADNSTSATIVGVVADTKRVFLSDGKEAMIYQSQTQRSVHGSHLLVKTSGDPLAMTPQVRETIWSLRPNQPISEVRSMEQVLEESLQPWQWSAMIMGGFSIFALLLAGIGIYGVVSYATSQRTSEIGVRLALGAEPRDILRLILRKALLLAGIGMAVGGLVAFVLSRLMESLLYGIDSRDPLTYAAVLILLGLVSVLAATAPAVRASRTDPAIALRYE